MISLNEVGSISETTEKPTKTYRLDLDNGRITGYVDGIEAVQQYIKKTLLTPRFKCLAYTSQYGSEIEAMLVANKWDREIIEELLPPIIKEALIDSRIIDIYNFSFEDGDDCLFVKFTVDTVYGETDIKEAVQIV
ncbi:MAG: DUF2634 domain-containing protein [Clostridia bacterium]|nr:DUF2634 domain-containing protein [Clostridia bacterium]